jgi:dephospho-CoA kinase
VVIQNDGAFEDTWKQVVTAWQTHIRQKSIETGPLEETPAVQGQLTVAKARLKQSGEIANFITRLSAGARNVSPSDIMAAFGEKAFITLRSGAQLSGLVGWQVENLVARTDDVYLEQSLPLEKSMQALLEEVERASRDLQCEASLLFLPAQLAQQTAIWKNLGYEPRSIESLGVRAWQEAAQESISADEVLFFKQLRVDRVLRPV